MIRTCPACGTKNRIPARHLAHQGRCGSCKASLPPVSEPIDADETLFREIVTESPVPVLVDFWAAWCGPCRAVAPQVHALAKEVAGRAIILKVNTEEQQGLAAEFRIQSIPNFVVLNGGQVVIQRAGAAPLPEMRRWIEMAAQTVNK